MTMHGTLDFVITNSASASLETFVTLYNFFQNNTGTLGIVPLHANSGSGGLGFGYQNSATPVGNNCWAVFEFSQATIPFYVLIQAATGSNASDGRYPVGLSGSVGEHAVLQGNDITAVSGGLGISVALRFDGGNPWNGSSGTFGGEFKGHPVWIDGTSTAYVWPRSNSISGTYSALRENLMMLTSQVSASANSYRYHAMADKDNLLILHGRQNFSSPESYDGFFFGKVTLNPNRPLQYTNFGNAAYVCVSKATGGSYFANVLNGDAYLSHMPPFAPFSSPTFSSIAEFVSKPVFVYGSATGSNFLDGGVMWPTASVGIKSCILDSLTTNMLYVTAFGKNTCFATSTYDLVQPMVIAYEPPEFYGNIGSIDFFSYVLNQANHVTESNGTLAVFGTNTGDGTTGYLKIVTPWSGTLPPGSAGNGSRAGTTV